MNKAIVFLVLLIVSPAAYAVDYTVGGNSGWNTGFNYVSWASGQTFTTSDSLVFNFGPSHAVDEVTQADYQSCNGASPISTSTSSPTTIDLTAPGTRYFICPRSNHCSQGQRLAITVTSGGSSPGGPSPPAGTTPSPPTGATPSPPSGTPSGPAPSSAMSILSSKSSLMVGFSLVLAVVLV